MSDGPNRWMRIIVNGKSAGDPALREAVATIREQGYRLEVRVTWEGGDAARYAGEAVKDQIDVVIAAGGDGTINEVVNGVLQADDAPKIAVGIVPYGTANDFATGCGIPKGDRAGRRKQDCTRRARHTEERILHCARNQRSKR